MGMTTIVKTVARLIIGFIFLYGVHSAFYGHINPGGGFEGGVIIASAFILLTLAFGKEKALKKFSKIQASEYASLAAFIFILLGILGIFIGEPFLSKFIREGIATGDFELLSAGTVFINNILVAIMVGSSVYLVFVILAVLRVVQKGESLKMVQTETREEE